MPIEALHFHKKIALTHTFLMNFIKIKEFRFINKKENSALPYVVKMLMVYYIITYNIIIVFCHYELKTLSKYNHRKIDIFYSIPCKFCIRMDTFSEGSGNCKTLG